MNTIKRWSNLITKDNITKEFCKECILLAANHKTSRHDVIPILNNIDYYAYKIQDLVLTNTFVPSEYGLEIKVEYGKERKLQKPRFYPDQVIHHLLINIIKDKLVKRIDPYAISSFPGRGIAYGVKKLKYWIQAQSKISGHKADCKYCLKLDIKHCFDSVKPDIVYREMSKIIKDKLWLSIFKKVIYSTDSLPLGNYMSAWILNLILKPIDQAIRSSKHVTHYLRYMDDFVIFSKNKRELHKLLEVIRKMLASLNLEIKHNYQVIRTKDGLDIIGYRFFPTYTILRKRNFLKLVRQIDRLSKMNGNISIHECLSIVSRVGQLKLCCNGYIKRKIKNKLNYDAIIETISQNSKNMLSTVA